MGNIVAKNIILETPINIQRYILRKTRRFNVIPRAEKKIDHIIKNKSERAPLHAPQQSLLDESLKQDPGVIEKYSEKNGNLNENLKKVYVKSVGDNKDGFSSYMVPVPPGGYPLEPRVDDSVPVGHYTLDEASHFLLAYQKKPEEFSVESLASLLKIDEEKMKNIVTHVKVFKTIHTPKTDVPWYTQAFHDLQPTINSLQNVEDKALQILGSRDRAFKRYRKEVLKLPDENRPPYKGLGSLFTNRYPKNTDSEKEMYYTDNQGPLHTYVQQGMNRNLMRPEDFKFDVFKEVAKKKRKLLEVDEEKKKIEGERSHKAIEDGEMKNEQMDNKIKNESSELKKGIEHEVLKKEAGKI